MSGRMLIKHPDHDDFFIQIESGRLDVYNKIAGIHRKTAFLQRVESGSCPVGEWFVLPGKWTQAPEVIFSPKSIQCYVPGYSYGRQTSSFVPTVEDVGNGQFRIKCEHSFVAQGNAVDVHPSYTDSIGDSFYTASYGPSVFRPLVSRVYPSPGGNLSFQCSYRAAKADRYYARDFETKLYVDVFRGSMASTLVETRNFIHGSARRVLAHTLDVGNGPCSWRLRLMITDVARREIYPEAYGMEWNLLLETYSFSTYGATTAPQGEVFYLAIGR